MNGSDNDNLEGRQGEERRENTYGNPYTSESSEDIYATPDVTAAPEIIETEVVDTHGLFSGSQQEPNNQENYSANPAYPGNSVYPPADNGYGGYGGQSYYGNQQGGYGVQPPYGNQQGGYGVQPPYGNQQGAGYGGQPPYGSQQSAGYGGQSYYESQQGMGYGGQPSYGNQQGTGYGGQPPYGSQPPYNNPYSPYAVPQKGQHTGLIIGIVVGIIILFLVAVFALASRAADMLSEKEKDELRRDVYNFDDAFDFDDDDEDYFHNDDDYGYDFDDDYDYSDYFDDGYDYGFNYDYDYDYDSDEYYTIHSDIKDDLSYQVEMEYYEYEPDFETDNLMLIADYPVISGDEVPNLDKLNQAVRKELDRVIDLFEKDYKKHMQEGENGDGYFIATLAGYVTYMDEDKLSVIYQEEIYSDIGTGMDGGVYLICVNVDMKNGVVLDNKEILKIDDAFSVDFRERSDEQNGEIDSLNYMTDQEITKYFNSDDVIVFYTPKGMEIGFNYEDGYGWVTVTYEEYEEYLKVF